MQRVNIHGSRPPSVPIGPGSCPPGRQIGRAGVGLRRCYSSFRVPRPPLFLGVSFWILHPRPGCSYLPCLGMCGSVFFRLPLCFAIISALCMALFPPFFYVAVVVGLPDPALPPFLIKAAFSLCGYLGRPRVCLGLLLGRFRGFTGALGTRYPVPKP